MADLENRRIRAVDLKTGLVSTIAGNGSKGVPEDGAEARSAPLVDPRAVAVDGRGNVYILERSAHALRVVDHSNRTWAGSTGRGKVSGDGGDARKATLNGPKHLCVDQGNVVIADTENHRIRMYRPADATIVSVAGSGRKGTAGLGGPPAEAELNQLYGVTIGPGAQLYICDSSNNRTSRSCPEVSGYGGTDRLHLSERNVGKVLIDKLAMSFDPLAFVADFDRFSQFDLKHPQALLEFAAKPGCCIIIGCLEPTPPRQLNRRSVLWSKCSQDSSWTKIEASAEPLTSKNAWITGRLRRTNFLYPG